jgi:radical SAM protein with 4Fe4S-binding SPASM domain
VKDEKLEVLVEKKKKRLLFLDFRDPNKLPGNCGRCENNSFCFGCRSSAYYYGGDILAADPKCYQFSPATSREKIRD